MRKIERARAYEAIFALRGAKSHFAVESVRKRPKNTQEVTKKSRIGADQ